MHVLEISVQPSAKQLHLVIEMPNPDCFLTSQVPHLPRQLLRLLPRLGEHTCHNDHGLSFREECFSTEIPHLLEHLIIELQLQAQQNPDDYLRGETTWNWQVYPRGIFHVSVDYTNEMLAVASVRTAERIINALLYRQKHLDIATEIARLQKIFLLSTYATTTAIPVLPENIPLSPRSWENIPLHPVKLAA